jgi:cytochrome subunit of sulfide dehydrogenase
MISRLLLAAAFLCASGAGLAQDKAAATRSLAATCAGCHGTEGRSVTKEVASLAGMPKAQLISQMQVFKDGTRPATVMHQIAKGYTDQQIVDLADYFAGKK